MILFHEFSVGDIVRHRSWRKPYSDSVVVTKISSYDIGLARQSDGHQYAGMYPAESWRKHDPMAD